MTTGTRGHVPARHWLVRSKLELPRNNMRLIKRQGLISRMDRWLQTDLGLVVGPAGYAKSTTIAQWCLHQQANGTTVAWLSLDEADREPAQFLSYLIASLSAAGIATGGLDAGAEEGFFAGGISTALASLIEAVREFHRPVVLVLDDYHRVDTPKVDELVRALLGSQSPNFTLVISSRVPLPFDIGSLLASGRAEELDSEALRFSKGELASVFGDGGDDKAIALLYERTEGWPVAVQLARLLIADSLDYARLDRLHGHTGHIATYLAEQILEGLPQNLQDFLCFTAPLERFTLQLANAVTESGAAERMVELLEPLNALVVRVDGEQTAYRYHHLFSEFLQTELRRRHGEKAAELVHRRASIWYEANGYITEAVRHAREAGQLDRCTALVETAGGWELILFGGIGYLRGLLQQIPDDVALKNPRILLAKAYLGVKDGLLAESRALVDIARQSVESLPTAAPLKRDILNVGALICVYEDALVSPAELKSLDAQFEQFSSADPLTRAILSCQLMVCELSSGQFAAAEHRAQATMRTMREARTVLGLNYCYLHAGLAAMYQGRLKAAEAHFGIARRMAEENFSFDPGLRALSRLLDGCLQHWLGGAPGNSAEQVQADLDHVEQYDGWLDIYASGLTVECLGLRCPDAAIVRGSRIAEKRGLMRLGWLVDSLRLGTTANPDRNSLAIKIRADLPDGIWRQEPTRWLPFLESRLALAAYLAGIDRSKAISALDSGLECARKFGAMIHAVRVLVARALLHDLSGQRARAVEDLIEAVAIAAAERMVGPFLGQRGLVPLLRAVCRQAHDAYVDILIIEFANLLITRLSRNSCDGEWGQQTLLSPREREVLEELVNGRSNKEIARLLDMTEHTVKFHLKNVFTKLGAERRTEAVARAKELKLI